jgi:hypothetical protein
MANTVASVLQVPSGATLGPAGQYIQGPGDWQDPAIVLKVTINGDGATTGVLTVNWIDGVQTLPFTPSMVRAHMTQLGTAAAGALAADNGGLIGATARVSAITATSFGLNITTAITNAATAVVFVEVFK